MESRKLWLPLLGISILVSAFALVGTTDDGKKDRPDWRDEVEGEETEIATLAGGCFWCIEAIYENKKGVKSAVSGYAGGSEQNATYEKVSTGQTDHREAVRIEYYPSLITYEEILDMYWKSIDPTDPGGQFSDRGFQYTTAIYYHDEEQKRIAERTKRDLEEGDKFEEPIVTEIINYTTFFSAEDYHQNYSERRTLRYNSYKKASGRESFLESLWKDSPIN